MHVDVDDLRLWNRSFGSEKSQEQLTAARPYVSITWIAIADNTPRETESQRGMRE